MQTAWKYRMNNNYSGGGLLRSSYKNHPCHMSMNLSSNQHPSSAGCACKVLEASGPASIVLLLIRARRWASLFGKYCGVPLLIV